jgi:integrase
MPKGARPVGCRGKWRIRWIDAEGRRQSDVFDSYNEAERQLRKRQVEAEEVRRGQRRAAPPEKTFGNLCDYWIEHRAVEKRSRKDDLSIIRRHLRPAFGAIRLRDLGVEHFDRYKEARAGLSPKTVANHLTLTGTMLRLAVEDLHWLLVAPAIRKPRVDPDDEVDPPWLKTQDEIRRLLDAARAEAEPGQVLTEVPFVLYATAVYTGMRAGELAGLRWDDVDLERRTIHVRRSYAGKTKTRASRRHVPIVDALLPVLRGWQLRWPQVEGGWVFPGQTGKMLCESARVFQEVLHRCLDRAGFARPTAGRHVHAIHFHSLRHTFACHWRLNGGPLDDLIRVLGHTSKAMTEVYANVGGYHRPAHFALFPTAARGPAAEVIPLRSAEG